MSDLPREGVMDGACWAGFKARQAAPQAERVTPTPKWYRTASRHEGLP